MTPLITAAYNGQYQTVEWLLKAGVDTSYKDSEAQTALDAAVAQGHSQVAELLQDYQFGGRHKTSREGIVFDHFSAKLNALVGLNSIKVDVIQLVNYLRFQKLREDKGLSVPEQSRHMVFTGNPGPQSRFNKFLHFDDYAPAELTEIFGYFAAQGDYKLLPATELKLHNVFADLYAKRDETFGNARLARNLFEKVINAHANRMVSAGTLDEASLVTLYPEDVPSG